ncbi:hypothetical protein [Rossellomorea marisflavi]|uniref:hypothetical protein n=1 Tax=Rossellomorea marisflavi TaxID=189381 RepID=UPI003F9F8CE5
MKARYKKHLDRIKSRSPIVGFSRGDLFNVNQVIHSSSLEKFSVTEGLLNSYDLDDEFNYKLLKKYKSDYVYDFTDNYLMCGGHRYVYILIPVSKTSYKIVVKESIADWQNKYWEKEDPNNERRWSYIDEDINDLCKYIMNKFNKYVK